MAAREKDQLLTIGELAAVAGVSPRTIRYYEELGIIPEPERSPGGTRRYSKEYQFYIEGALALKDLGFSLEEIQLIGRMALGRPMGARQRQRVATVVAQRMRALEHRIRVLERLRGILEDEEQAGNPQLWRSFAAERTGTEG